MLNTAAHFPSDTAAKVERALEQLSDINEAAINNDRTVTAATKVNGKGLSSTMGDIHLNPASINTNRGGTINFHYNQASSTTSSIYENASGQVRIDGNLYLNGNTTNGFKVKGGSLEAYTHTDTTANQTRDIIVYGPDGTSRISTLRNKYYTNGNKELEIFVSQDVDGSTVFNSLRMTNDTEGNRRCFLNYSPATTSNSTDVATTAYTRAYTSATYLPLSCSSPITGTIMKDTTHVRGGTDVYAAKDTVPLLVRDANGKNWFRLITSQRYTSSSDFSSSVGFYLYHPTNASQNGNVANIAVGYNQDGPYTQAPTPATSDNSTKIATTAFVVSKLNSVYKDLGDNYVMDASDFDKQGVIYRIGSLSTTVTNNIPSGYNAGDFYMYCNRTGNYATLIGCSPRSDTLYYAKFWGGSFNGWSVFQNVLDLGSVVTVGYNDLTVPSGTVTNAQSITLDKGMYLLYLSTYWTSNQSGYRQIGLATTTTGSNIDRYTVDRTSASGINTSAYNNLCMILNITATSGTYYHNVYQNSGSSLTAAGGYKYIRIR